MGCCCCQGKAVHGLPNDIPDPPPLCELQKGLNFIQRVGTAGGYAGSSVLSALNDSAWSELSAATWSREATTHPEIGLSLQGSKNWARGAAFEAMAWIFERLVFSGDFGQSVAYAEKRMYAVLPLIHEVGGTQYSLEGLYGVTEMTLQLSAGLIGLSYDANSSSYGNQAFTYNASTWSKWDVSWGMADHSQMAGPFSEATPAGIAFRLKDTEIANGVDDIATTSLITNVAVPNTNIGLGVQESTQVNVDIDSITGETGGDYLVILFETAPSEIVKKTPSIAAPSWPTVNVECWGPKVRNQSTFFLNANPDEYLVEEIWGCILAMVVNVDIDPDGGSDAVAEDRTATAFYDSGTALTKQFKVEDNDPSPTTETDTFDASGTWTAPFTGNVEVEVWGGGGGGRVEVSPADAGGAGGGGAYSKKTVAVTKGVTYTVTVGSGGTAGDPASNGNASWFSTTGTVFALGGSGASTRLGGLGGLASGGVGDTKYDGGDGGDGEVGTSGTTGGGGGAGADSTGDGVDGSDGSLGGAGGIAVLDGGNGGAGGTFGGAGATKGTQPGGGGGGGPAGEDGADGRVKVSYDLTVNRETAIYLTETGGNYFLTFDYHRYSTPATEKYYIKETFGGTGAAYQVGSGTTYETIDDLEGVTFPHTHSGANNDDPSEGTEDCTIDFTIESISVGQP